ncbi:helix-turn-helix domain-containing protein, partial [Streptomyces sp. NPDC059649]|uniref:helix-turn-helix domain-containing protein n=1 Tax=Streptomyces sp. NPDC059649 TaxID=3346895 RepID=UPI0036BD5D89
MGSRLRPSRPHAAPRTSRRHAGRPPGPASHVDAVGRLTEDQLLTFSLVLWVWRACWWDPDVVSFKPSPVASRSVVPPLTRPQLAEARRVRAAELFGQGRTSTEIARMLEVSHESVRRWRRVWEEGGTDALRRRPATGRPPKLDDAQVERVR